MCVCVLRTKYYLYVRAMSKQPWEESFVMDSLLWPIGNAIQLVLIHFDGVVSTLASAVGGENVSEILGSQVWNGSHKNPFMIGIYFSRQMYGSISQALFQITIFSKSKLKAIQLVWIKRKNITGHKFSQHLG